MTLAATTTAVVVVYRADANPEMLLRQLCSVVPRVVLVDNAEVTTARFAELARQLGVTLIGHRNEGGLAGAYNKALTHLDAAPPAQVVFLDEDTDAATLGRFLADPVNASLLRDASTAAVAPAYRDRATGLRGKHLRLAHWRLHYLSRSFEGVERVSFVINSMAVWRHDSLTRLGRFDEGLAIDHIDTDMCLRAAHAGLGIYVNGAHEFLHSIGERRAFKLFGREMQAGGHSAQRRWLIGRNTVWLARRECFRQPAFSFLCVTRLAYEVVGIVKAEDDAGPKLRALLRGAWQGLFTRRLRWTPGAR